MVKYFSFTGPSHHYLDFRRRFCLSLLLSTLSILAVVLFFPVSFNIQLSSAKKRLCNVYLKLYRPSQQIELLRAVTVSSSGLQTRMDCFVLSVYHLFFVRFGIFCPFSVLLVLRFCFKFYFFERYFEIIVRRLLFLLYVFLTMK